MNLFTAKNIYGLVTKMMRQNSLTLSLFSYKYKLPTKHQKASPSVLSHLTSF